MSKTTRSISQILRSLILPLVAVIILLCFIIALNNLDNGQTEEGRLQLEDSIRRAAVACYAAEGIYPPDVEYLQNHYGIQIDEEKYAVFYDVFGSNLMPEITVVVK